MKLNIVNMLLFQILTIIEHKESTLFYGNKVQSAGHLGYGFCLDLRFDFEIRLLVTSVACWKVEIHFC